MKHALHFPADKPDEYIRLQDEPDFNAAAHLALERPARLTSMAELGYTE